MGRCLAVLSIAILNVWFTDLRILIKNEIKIPRVDVIDSNGFITLHIRCRKTISDF